MPRLFVYRTILKLLFGILSHIRVYVQSDTCRKGLFFGIKAKLRAAAVLAGGMSYAAQTVSASGTLAYKRFGR